MAAIFVSYASTDRARASLFAEAFERQGWSVWWDGEVEVGEPFDQAIQAELDAAGCVVVLWSNASVRSRWVRDEADAAARRHVLLPIAIEDVELPLGFRGLQTARLGDWNGESDHPEWVRLLKRISGLVSRDEAEESAPAVLPSRRFPGLGAGALASALLVALLGGYFWQRTGRSEAGAPERPAPSPATWNATRHEPKPSPDDEILGQSVRDSHLHPAQNSEQGTTESLQPAATEPGSPLLQAPIADSPAETGPLQDTATEPQALPPGSDRISPGARPSGPECQQARDLVAEVVRQSAGQPADPADLLDQLKVARTLCPVLGEAWKHSYCWARALGREQEATAFRKRAAFAGVTDFSCPGETS